MDVSVSLQSRLVKSPDQVATEIDGQSVAMDVNTGVYFVLDDISTRIWSLLDQEAVVEGLCDRLVGEYDVDVETCRRDVLTLLRELCQAGLLKPA